MQITYKELGGIWVVQQRENGFYIYEHLKGFPTLPSCYQVLDNSLRKDPRPQLTSPLNCKIIPFALVNEIDATLHKQLKPFRSRIRRQLATLMMDRTIPIIPLSHIVDRTEVLQACTGMGPRILATDNRGYRPFLSPFF